MRSSAQISRSPAEWAERQRDERQRALRGLLVYLQAHRHEHWYRWVTEGQPVLSQAEYDAEQKARRRRRS